MPISIFCMFFAFGSTNLVFLLHQKLRTPSWLVAVLTPVLVAAFWVTCMSMPFHGIVTEAPLVLLAAIAGSGPVTLIHRANEQLRAAREQKGHSVEFRGTPASKETRIPLVGAIAMGLFLPTMAGTMMTLVSRENYACWLNWECDGKIVAVTRNAGNHNAPMILVEAAGKTESFTQVDDKLWSQAKPGMRLTKPAGSPMATLDGRKVRMAPLQMNWWNDAK